MLHQRTTGRLWWEDPDALAAEHSTLQACCARYVPWWLAHSLAADAAYLLSPGQAPRMWLAVNATLLHLGMCLGTGFVAVESRRVRSALCLAAGGAALGLHCAAVWRGGGFSEQGALAAAVCLAGRGRPLRLRAGAVARGGLRDPAGRPGG